MIGGFNNFRDEQKAVKGEAVLSLYQFDSSGNDPILQEIYTAKALSNVPDLELNPRGMTPLLDAIFQCIGKTQDRIGSDERKIIFVIITDGLENASRETTAVQLKKVIEERTADKWEFVFLGANQESITTASGIGISGSNAMNYSGNKESVTCAFSSLSSATTRSRTTSRNTVSNYFDSDEQDQRSKK
jgi:hypothetical protein